MYYETRFQNGVQKLRGFILLNFQMSVLVETASTSEHHACASCFLRLEEDIGSCGTVFISSCDMLCGCWEWNTHPLKEQQVFLSVGPPFQPPRAF